MVADRTERANGAKPGRRSGPEDVEPVDRRYEVVRLFDTHEQALRAIRALEEVTIPAALVEDDGPRGTVLMPWDRWKVSRGGIGVSVPRFLLPEARVVLGVEPDDEDEPYHAEGPNDHERRARTALMFAVVGLTCFFVGQVVAVACLLGIETKRLSPRYATMRRVAIALLVLWSVGVGLWLLGADTKPPTNRPTWPPRVRSWP